MEKEVLKLKHPLPGRDGEPSLEQLEFRRLKASDFKKLPPDMYGHNMGLLARSTSLPPSVLGDLDGEDYTAAMEVMMRFLGISQPTGNQESDGSPTE